MRVRTSPFMNRSVLLHPIHVTRILRGIRLALLVVMAGLLLSGITAFPLVRETGWLLQTLAHSTHLGPGTPLFAWMERVHGALLLTNSSFPFLAYGTDRLAFAHIALAVLFFGPLREPVRNQWVVNFGLMTCAGLVPLAFISGAIHGIPVFWRCLDCSFALCYAIPLLLCRHYIRLLERLEHTAEHQRLRRRQHRRLRRHPTHPKPIA